MATIALVTAGKAEVVNSIEQKTVPCSVAITAGQPIQETTTGKWILALGTTAAACRNAFIATRNAVAGEALTGVRKGVMDGFDFTSQAYNTPIYIADDGTLADAAGTVVAVVGYVRSAWDQQLGVAADKVLQVDVQTVAVA